MARRMRAPKIPGSGPSGPKHNHSNRNTRESRQRERMLDASKQNYFKYELQDLLKSTPTAPELHNSLIQTLWAKGSRTNLSEAKVFLNEKVKEGAVDTDTQRRILNIVEKYSTWR